MQAGGKLGLGSSLNCATEQHDLREEFDIMSFQIVWSSGQESHVLDVIAMLHLI